MSERALPLPADVKPGHRGPYHKLDRHDWSKLRADVPLTLDGHELERLRGLGERIDLTEVREIYLPLCRVLNLYFNSARKLRKTIDEVLGIDAYSEPPFVIGVAGGVAAGKSTTARVLRSLLAVWPEHRNVDLVTTDGFLLANKQLEQHGLLGRKGFPESYDQRALLRFMVKVKSGAERVTAPVYSHLSYDVVPGAVVTVCRPDILIVEGLNVLQPAQPHADGRRSLAVSDFFDFSIYVDARPEDLLAWYVQRFLALRSTAFSDPASYFTRYADLTDDQAATRARDLYKSINEVNLFDNIRLTRGRATVVLQKGPDHGVQRVWLRS